MSAVTERTDPDQCVSLDEIRAGMDSLDRHSSGLLRLRRA